MTHRGLWVGLTAVLVGSFAALGYFGREVYRHAPPIPNRVVGPDGRTIFTGQDIRDGQNVWQSLGGQQLGSVWGHGSYIAPDWSADHLHRQAEWIRDHGGDPLDLRRNSYDPATREIRVTRLRADAIHAVASHYDSLFGGDPALDGLRDAYAMRKNTVPDPARRHQLNAFFFWTSWACSTNRPGEKVTYTSNWPAEELVHNRPSGQLIVWSVISFVLLLAGIGALAWYFAVQRKRVEPESQLPEADPLLDLQPTPSMKSTIKYFWTAVALIFAQMAFGVATAHYGVEGSGFYGIPLSEWLPYSVTRTWHLQLGIFWIATTWLATGLFLAPAVSGHEPRFQRLGVNVLFGCLVVIVVGSLAGQWLGIFQKLDPETNFAIGHQGYEYVDLGRFWQIFLLAGLGIWFVLMARAMLPALRRREQGRSLLVLFLLASAAIGFFYAAGLMWGRQTHLAIAEYWRWWVVHLWVEGFFEVFATVSIAFLFTRMRLLETGQATAAVLFSTIIFLSGGILGTFHHLYFTGTTLPILAIGATFSALEVVPLVLIGFAAYEHLTLARAGAWVDAYRWPIYFFVAVAFWNFVGAGLFGFFINPPIALYYMQGLNTTPVHGHAALFGVYGMLGIGLMLFCLKARDVHRRWKTGAIRTAFWAINVGLGLMIALSLLPVGLLQARASVEHGYWYARSAEFLQTPTIRTFHWLRILGDSIFAIGMIALAWFIVGLKTGWSAKPGEGAPTETPREPVEAPRA